MNLNELNEKRKRLTTWTQVGLLVLALVVAPVIYTVIKGLVGLAIALLTGLAIVTFAPAVGMKFANWKLKAIKAEAAKNPVETLQNVYNERLRQKDVFKDRIASFGAKVSGFADKVEGFKTRFPKDAAKFEAQLEQMRLLLERRQNKYRKVSSDLKLFAGVIERADALWQMGLAAAEMNEAAGQFDGEQVYERIKVETALDSVQDSMNAAFSEMESDLLEDDLTSSQPSQLEFSAAETLELEAAVNSKVLAS